MRIHSTGFCDHIQVSGHYTKVRKIFSSLFISSFYSSITTSATYCYIEARAYKYSIVSIKFVCRSARLILKSDISASTQQPDKTAILPDQHVARHKLTCTATCSKFDVSRESLNVPFAMVSSPEHRTFTSDFEELKSLKLDVDHSTKYAWAVRKGNMVTEKGSRDPFIFHKTSYTSSHDKNKTLISRLHGLRVPLSSPSRSPQESLMTFSFTSGGNWFSRSSDANAPLNKARIDNR